MASSCSSENNGCAACAPAISIFYVSALANETPPQECPVYLNSSTNKSFNNSYFVQGDSYRSDSNYTSSYSYLSRTEISENETETTVTTTVIGSSSENGEIKNNLSGRISSVEGTSSYYSQTITITDSCGNSSTSTTTFASTSGQGCGNTQCYPYSNDSFTDFVTVDLNCYAAGHEECSTQCDSIENCEGNRLSTSSDCSYVRETDKSGSNARIQYSLTYSNPIDETLLSPNSIVSRRISKLKNNNFAPACKCGAGKKDDCWGLFTNFVITDPAENVSKAAIRIGVIKDGFDKTYTSVSGIVNFYIPTQQDIEEGRTPCCNDDFSGTTVTSLPFSLGGSDFKEGVYLATDIGELTNSSGQVGGIVLACITVNNIEFV